MENVLSGKLNFSYYLNQIKSEGNIVYEYNPLRNFRVTQDTDENGYTPADGDKFNPEKIAIEGGSIVDLDTKLLNFSLNNPVEITVQKSYDGSDNLILNDNRNIPRLINSRFSVLPKNRYEIVDRVGNNDTNIYDDSQFDQDTSLYKVVNYIPKVKFNGVLSTGNLKVGNYNLYFKYADSDGNETDFVAESSIISCFLGNDKDPFSIQGGLRDENSHKSISITISNIDPAYDYIKVYYTRTTSDKEENPVISAFKIEQNYNCANTISTIIITGDEKATEIPLSEINMQYFVVDKVNTQEQCQNRLFLGNVNKPKIEYTDLQDISLRIYPTLKESKSKDLIGEVNSDYEDSSLVDNNYEYYNTYNIYNYVGYWGEEIYRLGVVYILNDYTLSPVFNIRGTKVLHTDINSYGEVPSIFDDSGDRKYISILESSFLIENSNNDNSKGVFQIPKQFNPGFVVNGIQINIPKQVVNYLSNKVKGLFFVRQKRIPTILCQTITLPVESCSEVPLLKGTENRWFIEGFLDNSGAITQNYSERLKYVDNYLNTGSFAGICPEYDLRRPYFNQLFTGTTYVLSGVCKNNIYNSSYDNRRYIVQNDESSGIDDSLINSAKVISVDDNISIVATDDSNFRARAGEAEEAYKFRYIKQEQKIKDNYNIVRGIFGPYLGIKSNLVQELVTYNIKIPGYSEANIDQYFNIRYYDDSAYYPISDRISIQDIETTFNVNKGFYINTCYRGDCYICNITHRLNRNFQDPEAPTNDMIVDSNTWKDNYDPDNTENFSNINRGDINAVQLGSWITLKVLSTYNLNIRSQDYSNTSEVGLTGNPRSFYPIQYCSPIGNNKIPESSAINNGFGSSSGQKIYYTMPDVPYIKNRFDNRIVYSDISVNDAFKNGFRVFQLQNYKDYPRTYGGLTKLINLQGVLLAIWEHGVGIIPVNERTLSGQGAGGEVFINTSNVLPDNPKMLSDMYGSQWKESIVKTPYYVYGVDTVGKKIWRTNGVSFEIISDFIIQEFLNKNITLTERELDPIIGIRNVKTHYNAFKQDIMFTFYDNLYGFNEKAWNLCYNEILQKWITFYSWIPSYSENIDNIFFSFNRDTSKWVSKLGTSCKKSSSADGIVLDSVIIEDWDGENNMLDLVNRSRPDTNNTGIKESIEFTLERDIYNNYNMFDIEQGKLIYIGPRTKEGTVDISSWNNPVLLLNIKCNLSIQIDSSSISKPIEQEEYILGWKDYININEGMYKSVVAVTSKQILENSSKQDLNLNTDFWKHGQSGIIDIKDKIKPCFWYGKQHPFEFEFVVVDNPSVHKIFNNLQIISNKAKPESFHYEIIGESFDFNNDKKNLFVRQEITKDFYQYNGSNITYNDQVFDIETQQNKKSISFPLYYSRVDTINEIEDSYKEMTSPNKDYSNLSGSEIVYYDNLNEFRIWEHCKALEIEEHGRIRGNMNYQEDKWDVQINPIVLVEKNEDPWDTQNSDGDPVSPKVPITIGNSPIPEDFIGADITIDNIPEDLKEKGYTLRDIDVSDWGIYPIYKDAEGNIYYANAETRKEVKVKDKFVKIRVRYSGEDLAIITALKTIYNISYA